MEWDHTQQIWIAANEHLRILLPFRFAEKKLRLIRQSRCGRTPNGEHEDIVKSHHYYYIKISLDVSFITLIDFYFIFLPLHFV